MKTHVLRHVAVVRAHHGAAALGAQPLVPALVKRVLGVGHVSGGALLARRVRLLPAPGRSGLVVTAVR